MARRFGADIALHLHFCGGFAGKLGFPLDWEAELRDLHRGFRPNQRGADYPPQRRAAL
jgi:hypothetical protein